MSEPWDPTRSFDALGIAVDSNDRAAVRTLVKSLVADAYTQHDIYAADMAGNILYNLRRRRLFEEMREVADAFLNNGCTAFKIRKYYAQALLDLGYLAAAEDVLIQLKGDAATASRDTARALDERREAEKQWAEACGLLGRLHKDRYVNAHAPRVKRNQEALDSAIAYYYNCYAADENKRRERHWHGINAVALARLAKKHDVPYRTQFYVESTAETILKAVQQRRYSDAPMDIWATAIAMEANIALRQWDEAYRWAKEYADPTREGVDAFEIAGTLRQLEQVWELDVQHEPGSLLIPLLRARLIDLEGFDFRLGQQEPVSDKFLSDQEKSLEAVFGGNFLSFRVYCEGIRRAKAVARIGPSSEEPFGTGFLVDGADLDPRLEHQRLLLTCEHVVSMGCGALRPNRAVVTFRADDNSIRKFGVRSIVWSQERGKLDVSVLRLDGDASDLPTVPWARRPPDATEQRVLIFGHAEGGALSFSFGDNRLVDWNDHFLQYRAPTVHGSSGSPVFNIAWELIGVHHSGGRSLPKLSCDGTHEANEGSSVFAIRQAIQSEATLSLG